MPKNTRTPIDYKPQFGEAFFRPKEVVESELAAIDSHQPEVEEATKPLHRTNNRPTGRTNERPGKRTPATVVAEPRERLRVRHSFDVYQDQLLSLSEIQADRFRKTGRKPKVGELVQEAIDVYITTLERPDERTTGRTNESQ